MTEIEILNSKFENTAKKQLSNALDADAIHSAVIHQVVKTSLANKRQGTASTKSKSEVSGGGKKPFKQKGTGRARQGSSRSPLMVGGATLFGPKPRDYTQKVNKKMMLKAIHSVLADKHQSGKLLVVNKIESDGKTKGMHKLLESRGLTSSLIVTSDRDALALRAVSNLRRASGLPVEQFSVYEAIKYEHLIIEQDALDVLLARLS